MNYCGHVCATSVIQELDKRGEFFRSAIDMQWGNGWAKGQWTWFFYISSRDPPIKRIFFFNFSIKYTCFEHWDKLFDHYLNFRNRAIARRNDSLSSYVPTIYHSWLRTLSNQIKSYPIFLLAENRELNEMMVVALGKPFQRYQYSICTYLI